MSDEIFKIEKDKIRARAVYERARERYGLIKVIPRDKTFKLVEEYYETIKELLTSVMYFDGYKSLSHVKVIEYFSDNYKILSVREVKLIDDLRKIRHGIMYYGENVNSTYLNNFEKEIKEVITKLSKFVLGLLEGKK
ncbi:MAG: hypothetical protein AABX11_00120 [Nanoarchaeota archaeon]